MTRSNPPQDGNPGDGYPNETVQWWSTPPANSSPGAPVTGTDPTVLGFQSSPQQYQGSPYPQQPAPPVYDPHAAYQPVPPGYPAQQYGAPPPPPPQYGAVPQYAPQYGAPPPKKSNAGLIIGVIAGVVILIGAVVAAAVLLGHKSGAAAGGSSTGSKHDGNYVITKADSNACAMVDPTVLQKWAPTASAPEHTERQPTSYDGGSLNCSARYSGAGKYGSNDANLSANATFASDYGAPQYNSWHDSDTRTTGSGRASGALSGIGQQAYYASEQTDYSSFTVLDYTCAALDSNLSAKVELRVHADPGTLNTTTVANTCTDQLKKVFSTLHK
ncbi:hypothetical protein [Nocardia sp. alder85J]|uniref:hypothetical protein n=1 Tax=Nocardia sp. alder85J TaxID=2862949 RepID=UPI001CD43600|nr:hypothetical protein [Nocardia sp. alder85J]MCX4093798.1 hypothetical protein [Nocardia sp. alder85J]